MKKSLLTLVSVMLTSMSALALHSSFTTQELRVSSAVEMITTLVLPFLLQWVTLFTSSQ